MEVCLDKFGRVVIPKSIRDHLGLKPGSSLQIVEHKQEILLKINEEEPLIQCKEGVVVFTGKALGDIASAVAVSRNDRLKDIFSD